MSWVRLFSDGFGDKLRIDTDFVDGGMSGSERIYFETTYRTGTNVHLAFTPLESLQIADAIYEAVDYLGIDTEIDR